MIETIPNRYPEIRTTVVLTTPINAACPHSGEPQPGSFISVTYQPKEMLIELHAIEKYVAELSAGSDALDLETLAQMIAMACYDAIGSVRVKAFYRLKRNEVTCHVRL
jgi:NADPH-dependent 7-cyano-7-deazaguanine reductase QueF